MAKRNDTFFEVLEKRFTTNMIRHEQMRWEDVLSRLQANPDKVDILMEMERTGGEPDVVVLAQTPGEDTVMPSQTVPIADWRQEGSAAPIVFCDCSPESPSGRRSLCYDNEALQARKTNKPSGSVLGMAGEMGVEVLTEGEYRRLQRLGPFDRKTSSWVATPDPVRVKGGALFCDYRYGQVFTYHNGAESYYSSRGFRGRLEV